MAPFDVDILIPVWNRPVETRNCLVTLIDASPSARFILIDSGSDRETERLLEEFAEILGERALLLKTSANLGFVRAVNRGLAQSEAPCVVVARNTTMVPRGWLDPLLELAASRPEAGLIVPRLVREGSPGARRRTADGAVTVTEVAHGSFAALMVRRELLALQGGFDEELDGGVWCLKDYSRRALSNGFLTFAAEGAPVTYADEVLLGSVARREETVRRSAETCAARWGREDAFCVCFPKDAEPGAVRERLGTILRGARMGCSFTVIVHPPLHRSLTESGHSALHRNIALVQLPRFFAAGELRKIVGRLMAVRGETVAVAGVDGLSIPGVDGVKPFGWLEDQIRQRQETFYRQATVRETG
uniref:Glycosyltransferase n=1 Tax=Geobacter metallireducens TaxID=28232 RepID=A0A831XNB5_GEOME